MAVRVRSGLLSALRSLGAETSRGHPPSGVEPRSEYGGVRSVSSFQELSDRAFSHILHAERRDSQ